MFKIISPRFLFQQDTARFGIPPERAVDVFVDEISSKVFQLR